MVKTEIVHYIENVDAEKNIMIFEEVNLTDVKEEIIAIPDKLVETLAKQSDLFDNKNQYSMF